MVQPQGHRVKLTRASSAIKNEVPRPLPSLFSIGLLCENSFRPLIFEEAVTTFESFPAGFHDRLRVEIQKKWRFRRFSKKRLADESLTR